MAVHFCPALAVISRITLADQQVEFRICRRHVGTENGGIERIAFRHEADRMRGDIGMTAQFVGGFNRSGERDQILAAEMSEKVAGAAADQLQTAGRQECRTFVDQPHQRLGDISRGGGRLGDDRDAGQKRRARVFPTVPSRES